MPDLDSHPPPISGDTGDDEQQQSLNTQLVIQNFLDLVPEPSDEQFHKLASLMGMDYEVLEEEAFKLVNQLLEEEDVEDLLEDPDSPVQDSLDAFLIAYFLRVAEPSEEQIHDLANLVGLTPEQLEERVYSLISALSEDDGDDEEDYDDSDEDTVA